MVSVASLVSLIRQIRSSPEPGRSDLIRKLQEAVWGAAEGAISESESVEALLRDLAYDLDFYEPVSSSRIEDPSYYGESRLIGELDRSIRGLRELGVPVEEGAATDEDARDRL